MKTRKRSRQADVVLSVIVLLLTTFGLFVCWGQLQNRRSIAQYPLEQASVMPAFRLAIGSPPQMGWFVSGRTVGSLDLHPRIADSGMADLVIPVRGPRGRGRLIVWMQERFTGDQICSMSLITGVSVVLVPDEQSHCERE